MATNLPRVGTLSYSDGTTTVSFGVMEKCSISTQIIPDTARRVASYFIHTLNVESVIQADAGTDSTMQSYRKVLLQPGGVLHADDDLGFGDLTINVAGGARDVLWGPWPQSLSWEPLGGGTAARVRWSVQVAVTECRDANNSLNAQKTFRTFLEATYKVSYSIDESGYTSRNVSGTLRIPQTRKSPKDFTLTEVADQYRDQVTPRELKGFRRSPWSFNVDESKNVLTFSITDVEMPPNVPPENVINVQCTHDVQSTSRTIPAGGAPLWRGTISGTWEMAKDVPRANALREFSRILRQRSEILLENAQIAPQRAPGGIGAAADLGRRAQGAGGQRGEDTFAILRFLRFSEPIYAKVAGSFTAVYEFSTTLKNIARTSGLWTPTPTNWGQWKASLGNTAFHNRGNQKLALEASDDRLHDPCTVIEIVNPQELPRLPGGPDQPPPPMDMRPPPAEKSWLKYQANVKVEWKDNTVEHKPLPKKKLRFRVPRALPVIPIIGGGALPSTAGQEISLGDQLDQQADLERGRHQGVPEMSGTVPGGIVQVRGAPIIQVVLKGVAIRAGFPIPCPSMKTYGGVAVTPANDPAKGDGFEAGVMDTWMGLPIFRVVFQLRYLVPEIPRKAEVPRVY